MVRFLKFCIKSHVNIVFFFVLIALFLSPKASFAQAGTFCGNTFIPPEIECTTFYSYMVTFSSDNPCQRQIFNRDCTTNWNPFDPNNWTGDQCVPYQWPGEYCMGCYNNNSVWEAKHCKTAPTPTPTPPPPIPSCGDYTNCGSCTQYHSNGPNNCGWNGSYCEAGTSTCPTNYGFWYWTETDCSTNNNRCVIPTPTPTPTPAPPTPTPTPTPFYCSGTIDGSPYECYPSPCPTNWYSSAHNSDPGGTTCDASGEICCYYIPPESPTPTPTPTPAPASCAVTTSPNVYNLNIAGTGTVTGSVTSGLGTATINQMRFGSYNTSVAVVNPVSDPNSPYSTTVTAVAGGATAVWGTADLSDGRTCQSSGTTDTDINVAGPTPTPIPGLVAQKEQCNSSGTAWIPIATNVCVIPPSCSVPLPTPTTVPPPAYGVINVNGAVWADTNIDGVKNAGERNITGLPIKISGAICTLGAGNMAGASAGYSVVSSTTSEEPKNYLFLNAPLPSSCNARGQPGTSSYSVILTIPTGFQYSGGLSGCISAPTVGMTGEVQCTWYAATGNSYTFNFGVSPITYSISGKIFIDANGNEKSNGDSNYTGAVTITRSPALGTYSSPVGTGNYSFTNLPPGQYTITFGGLPSGNDFTYPYSSSLPPYSLIVTVGPSCSVPSTSEASCSSGNVINLNSGATNNSSAWIQSTGSDMRIDSGFNNPLPSANTYASIQGSGGTPGIIFSGALTPIFGAGQASKNQFNWQVGGSSSDAREVFTDTHSLIPSSYRFLSETAQGSGITPIDIISLDSSLAHGIYKVEGDLNLNGSSYTFGPGNFIILVNGNLNINKKIIVPIGSTAIFSVKGNITVNRAVGEIAVSTECNITTHAGCSIEGLYSADNNFIVDGLRNCAVGRDLRLNIAGSVIANAGRPQTSGTFVNNRTLCEDNASSPTVSFVERPDFMLNYPSLATQTTRAWQDIAP